MLTLKFTNGTAGNELIFQAVSVRRDGSDVYYTDEHENEIGMLKLEGKTVYVMNDNGSTVSTYRF